VYLCVCVIFWVGKQHLPALSEVVNQQALDYLLCQGGSAAEKDSVGQDSHSPPKKGELMPLS